MNETVVFQVFVGCALRLCCTAVLLVQHFTLVYLVPWGMHTVAPLLLAHPVKISTHCCLDSATW